MKACTVCAKALRASNVTGRCVDHPLRVARTCECGKKLSADNRSGKCAVCLWPGKRVPADRVHDFTYMTKVVRWPGEDALAFILSGEPVPRKLPYKSVTITAKDVVRTVADALDVPERDILGNSRFAPHVVARATCIKILRDAGMSFPTIGHRLVRDHTTVRHAYLNYDRYAARNPRVVALVERFAA